MRQLSHSQIEQWGQCERRWALTRIEQVPEAPSEALVFGSALHMAIEASGVHYLEHGAHLPLNALLTPFNDALEEQLAMDDPHRLLAADLPRMRLKGLAALRAWSDQVAPHYQPFAIEEPFEVEVPAIEEGATDVGFRGVVDGRTERDGMVTIVDWKSASRVWQPGIEHSKEQAAAYLMADQLAGREPAARRVTFIVLATVPNGDGYRCEPDFRPTVRTMNQISAYADGVRATAAAIDQAEASGNYPTRTGPLCGWCGVAPSCPAGQQWVKEHSRQFQPAIQAMMTMMTEVTHANG